MKISVNDGRTNVDTAKVCEVQGFVNITGTIAICLILDYKRRAESVWLDIPPANETPTPSLAWMTLWNLLHILWPDGWRHAKSLSNLTNFGGIYHQSAGAVNTLLDIFGGERRPEWSLN